MFICHRIYNLPPEVLSIRKEDPSLNCLHKRGSLAILGHTGPRLRMRLCLHLVLGLPSRIGHALCRSYTLSVVFESCTVLVVQSDRIGVVDNISG